MRPTFSRFGFFLAGFALLASAAQAQTMAFSISTLTATSAGQQLFGGTLGLYFTLNAPLTVSSLGYWDDGRDGVQTPLTVAIFDRTSTSAPVTIGGTPVSLTFTGTVGTLTGGIVATEFTATDTTTPTGPAGQFRLANLPSPLVLPAGHYALAAWGFDFANQNLNGSNDPPPVLDIESFGGNLTFDGSAFDVSAHTFPATLDPSDHSVVPLYVAATFSPDVVSAIPEPADIALALAALALAGAFIVRLRQRKLCATSV